jgi:hypothetical protein
MTGAKLRLAQAAMGKRGTIVADLFKELGVSSQTLYRHVSLPVASRWKEIDFHNESIAIRRSWFLDKECTRDAGITCDRQFRRRVRSSLIADELLQQSTRWAKAP